MKIRWAEKTRYRAVYHRALFTYIGCSKSLWVVSRGYILRTPGTKDMALGTKDAAQSEVLSGNLKMSIISIFSWVRDIITAIEHLPWKMQISIISLFIYIYLSLSFKHSLTQSVFWKMCRFLHTKQKVWSNPLHNFLPEFTPALSLSCCSMLIKK